MARNRFTTGTALDATQLNRALDSNLVNLVRNGNFEAWSAGTTQPPDCWDDTANGGTIEQSSSAGTFHAGLYGVHIVQTSAGAGDTFLKFPAWSRYGIGFQGRKVTASVWCKCAAASTAVLRVDDGVSTGEATHTGGGAWERLVVQLDASASATKMDVIIEVNKPGSGSAEAWFDQAQLVMGEAEGEWVEAAEDRCADATEYDNNGTDAFIRSPKIITGIKSTIALAGGAAVENVAITLPRGVYTPYFAMAQLRGTLATAKIVTVASITATTLNLRFQTADGTNLSAENVNVYYMVVGSGPADPTDQF